MTKQKAASRNKD